MGAKDFLKGMSQSDLDRSKVDRENRRNQPEYEPGQEADVFSDDFFNEGGEGNTMNGGGLNNDGFGGGAGFGEGSFGGGFGDPSGGFGQQPQQPPKKEAEDIFFDIITLGAKHVWKFSTELVNSFKGLTPKFWTIWGTNTIKIGIGAGALGVVTRLFGAHIGFDYLIGGILTTATGVLVLMLNIDSANNYTSEYVNEPTGQNSTEGLQDTPTNTFGGSDDDFFGNDSSVSAGAEELEEYDESADDDEYAEYEDDDDVYNMDLLEDEPEPVIAPAPSNEEALSALPDISKGTYTRQYLYDAFNTRLENITPDFSKTSTIDEDSDTFYALEENVRKAGKANGIPEEKLPELLSAKETLFTMKFETTRVKGLTAEKLGDELANIYAFNPDTGRKKDGVFATGTDVGESSYVTVFTGEQKMISLKDMYSQCKEKLLNTKYYIPVIIGVDQSGEVIWADFKDIESVLIAGMPRTGKSWLVQSVITQMCAFVSPRELHFYIGDPKDGISDFKAFTLPHVKKFASGDDRIVSMLRDIVKVEAPRRKAILGAEGFVNIWDFKKKYPHVDMPIIYVLIDEVVTLAMRMDKDTKAEFQGYLTELISQLPALGIRAFLIPHVIKNDIIAKKTTDLIQCRVSVCGNAEHIKDCLGVTEKQFPYKLGLKGEIALKMPSVSRDPLYLHSVVLSDDNTKNNDIFEYLRQVWMRLEPGCEKDSVACDADAQIAMNNLLNDAHSIPDDDLDIYTGDKDTKSEVVDDIYEEYDDEDINIDGYDD